jgi:putative ABC transport system substrate-binding protein
MQRRKFITLLGGAAAAWPLTVRAQQPERIRRIGVMMQTAETDPEGRARLAAFTKGLRDAGWTDGRNVRIDYRWAAGSADDGRALGAELAALTPDVLLAVSTPTLAVLKQETRTIPIIFVLVSDPVGQGFIKSLSHPGANITGFTNFEFSMMGKWLEILKEIAPNTRRVAIMFNPETAPYSQYYLPQFKVAASLIAVKAMTASVHNYAEIDSIITTLGRSSDAGIIVMSDTFTLNHRDEIISLAARNRIPVIYPYRYFATKGGLISYGVDTLDLFRRSASYVDRILRGEKPADLPVQAPTKYELVINLKTAKALGLTVPQTLLARADEVIE